MPQQQKLAWFSLGVCGLIALAYLALLPLVGGSGAMAAFALMAIYAFAGLFYRKGAAPVVFDERDRDVHAAAVKVAAGSVYLYFVAICMSIWQLRREVGSVPVSWLPNMVAFGMLVLIGSWAAATLLLYRRQGAARG